MLIENVKHEKGWWHITDLPVGIWTDSFKERIEYLSSGIIPKDRKNWKKLENKCIIEYREYNSNNRVHFMIKPCKSWEPSFETISELTTTKSLNNMVTIDTNNYPTKQF